MLYAISRPWVARFILCLAFVISLPCAVHGQDIPQWAQEHLSAWYAAHNAEDVAAKASLYAPETVRLPPNGEPLRGRDSLEKVFAENFRTTRSECSGDYDGIQVMGNLATGWGHETCTSTPKSGGASETTNSRWLSVFHRQGDEWLIVYETWEEVDQ